MWWGVFWGIVSAATFGLIPLFTVPLLKAGYAPATVLLYRFALGTVILLPIVLLQKKPHPRLTVMHHGKLACVSCLYMLAALLYFHAFRFLPSGVATTLVFSYPLMVMVLMVLFFHERFSWRRTTAIFLALAGVGMLARDHGTDTGASPDGLLGVVLALLCGLICALYYLCIKGFRLPRMSNALMTFYVMFWATLICVVNSAVTGTFAFITDWMHLGTVFLLALITAVVSNYALFLAIRRIGPTLVSILGAAEPFTAVVVGLLVFDEAFTLPLGLGFALIVAAITLCVLSPHRETQ